MPAYINIVSLANLAGLSRDSRILSRVLSDAGFIVTVNAVHQSALRRGIHTAAKFIREYPFDVNVFLEQIFPYALPLAPINCLLSNQEWLRDECRRYLPRMDIILCKTQHAHELFREMGYKAVFTSFTSYDRRSATSQMDYKRFLHLAGSNVQKGTSTVIDLWSRHPEWPAVKVIQSPNRRQAVTAANITYIVEHVDDELLTEMQNTHGIHLCPSEAEGFGHTIVEGMSCRALVITTNGAPMNEIVTPERGMLADYHASEPQRLGTRFYVDPRSLEEKVLAVMAMSEESKRTLGENARRWYEQNDRSFKRRIVEAIRSLLKT